MGTRADFYIGRGKTAQWIGSIAWDGYPEGITPHSPHPTWEDGRHLFDSETEIEFRERLEYFFENRDDVTLPVQGWPWPWENSNTTDFAYAFDGGKVYGTCFGHGWWIAKDGGKVYGTCFGHGWWIAKDGVPDTDEDHPKDIEWPDFGGEASAPAGSKRSGVMVFTAPAPSVREP